MISPNDLTAEQRKKYDSAVDRYLEWLNSFTNDYKLTTADAWADECQIISINPIPNMGEVGLEVWIFTWGTGDDGGPALLTATFYYNDLEFLTQHFDTDTQTIPVLHPRLAEALKQ